MMHGCGVIICMMLEVFFCKTAVLWIITKFADLEKNRNWAASRADWASHQRARSGRWWREAEAGRLGRLLVAQEAKEMGRSRSIWLESVNASAWLVYEAEEAGV